MHIVLVDWKINLGQEDEFKREWRSALPIYDRRRMTGEFLSEVCARDGSYPWITWDLAIDPRYKRFINVGLWADAEAFHAQVGRYFDPAGGKKPFEFELRQRALLRPDCWRMGDWPLPVHDSGGVI